MPRINYVILIGNDPENLVSLKKKILALRPSLKIDTPDICTFDVLIQQQKPDMIVLYIKPAAVLDYPYVDIIRKNPFADEIPLVICRGQIEESLLDWILHE